MQDSSRMLPLCDAMISPVGMIWLWMPARRFELTWSWSWDLHNHPLHQPNCCLKWWKDSQSIALALSQQQVEHILNWNMQPEQMLRCQCSLRDLKHLNWSHSKHQLKAINAAIQSNQLRPQTCSISKFFVSVEEKLLLLEDSCPHWHCLQMSPSNVPWWRQSTVWSKVQQWVARRHAGKCLGIDQTRDLIWSNCACRHFVLTIWQQSHFQLFQSSLLGPNQSNPKGDQMNWRAERQGLGNRVALR